MSANAKEWALIKAVDRLMKVMGGKATGTVPQAWDGLFHAYKQWKASAPDCTCGHPPSSHVGRPVHCMGNRGMCLCRRLRVKRPA